MRFWIRPAPLAAIAVLICVGAVATVLMVRRGRPLTSAQMVASLPATPGAVAYIDVRALRDSGLLDKILGPKLNEEADYKQFVTQTSFDYRSDLDHVAAKLTPSGNFFVLTGRFDWRSIIDYTTRNGGVCRSGFCRIQGSRPERMISFYPIRSDVMALAASKDDYAATLIKAVRSDAAAPVPAHPIWMSLPGTSIPTSENAPAGTRPFLRALQPAEKVLLTLGPDDQRFALGLDVTCKTPEDAAILRAQLDSLTDVVKKMIAQEKQTPNPADLSGVLTSGVFQRQGEHVIGKWAIERVFLDSLGGS